MEKDPLESRAKFTSHQTKLVQQRNLRSTDWLPLVLLSLLPSRKNCSCISLSASYLICIGFQLEPLIGFKPQSIIISLIRFFKYLLFFNCAARDAEGMFFFFARSTDREYAARFREPLYSNLGYTYIATIGTYARQTPRIRLFKLYTLLTYFVDIELTNCLNYTCY